MSNSLERVYDPAECITFRKTSEKFGGLSNMAPGFQVRVNGIRMLTVEALYQACRFPHIPELQDFIIGQRSPMTLKMQIKRHLGESRTDWERIRVRIMKWCIRVKLAQNLERFGKLLDETGEKSIVEDSRKDPFWGAIRSSSGHLVGANVLGRLLMDLREEFRNMNLLEGLVVPPPEVSGVLLFGRPVEELQTAIGTGLSWSEPHEVILKGAGVRLTEVTAMGVSRILQTAAKADAHVEFKLELSATRGCDSELIRMLQELLNKEKIPHKTTVKSSLQLGLEIPQIPAKEDSSGDEGSIGHASTHSRRSISAKRR